MHGATFLQMQPSILLTSCKRQRQRRSARTAPMPARIPHPKPKGRPRKTELPLRAEGASLVPATPHNTQEALLDTGCPNARAPMTALERELHALQASRPAGSPLPLHRLPPWPDFGNSHCPTTGRSSSCRPAQLAPCCRCHRRLGVECGHLAATVFRLCNGAAISVQPQCSVIAHLVRRRELHHTLNV